MHFLEVVAPVSDLHIDVDKFANTDSGKLIQAAINLGWVIILGNDTPIEKAVTEYILDRGGAVFPKNVSGIRSTRSITGAADAIWTHIIPNECLV